MAYRAKSLEPSEGPAQGKVQRRALKKINKKLKLNKRIAELAEDMIPDVMQITGLDEHKARMQARQWAMEGVVEMLAAHFGEDVVFLTFP